MFKVNLVTVGKIKEKYFCDAVDEYKKRIGRFCELSITEVKEESLENIDATVALKRESDDILKKIKGYVCVFAIEGKKYDSVSFAKKMTKIKNEVDELTLVIGSSCGLDNAVKNKADELISFSDMTFPHAMFRVMALEQIYRGFMIESGGKYHK